MIDFHSHIVYDVDDGSQTIENSIKILKRAEKAGFHSIILTPHYMEDYYEYSKEQIKALTEFQEQYFKSEIID